MPLTTLLKRCWQDHSGATAIEYALLAAMLGIIIVGIFATGDATTELYETLLAIVDAIAGAIG